MKQNLFINAQRTGYSVKQIMRTMTVSELIAYLEQFESDTPVYLKHDNGYTYGGISENDFEDETINEYECEKCGKTFYSNEWTICDDCRKKENLS